MLWIWVLKSFLAKSLLIRSVIRLSSKHVCDRSSAYSIMTKFVLRSNWTVVLKAAMQTQTEFILSSYVGWVLDYLFLFIIQFSLWFFLQREDEESKWLDALESGELDDFGRLKKEKDVSLMTARQVPCVVSKIINKTSSASIWCKQGMPFLHLLLSYWKDARLEVLAAKRWHLPAAYS